jgi:hypothetical protein
LGAAKQQQEEYAFLHGQAAGIGTERCGIDSRPAGFP